MFSAAPARLAGARRRGSRYRLVAGLAFDTHRPARCRDIEATVHGVDLVVVENVCSLPVNPPVTEAVVQALRGRRAVLRHHDLPWERERYATCPAGHRTTPAGSTGGRAEEPSGIQRCQKLAGDRTVCRSTSRSMSKW